MLRSLLAMGLLSIAGSAAEATVLQATYSGQIQTLSDYFGFFGTPGSTISGGAASFSFIYDTDLGAPASATSLRDALWGGPHFGAPSPVTSVSVSMGGKTVSANGTYSLLGFNDDPTGGQGFYLTGGTSETDPLYTSGTLFLSNYIANFHAPGVSVPASIETPFQITDIDSLSGQTDAVAFVSLIFTQCISQTFYCTSQYLHLSLEEIRTEVVMSPVPLPAAGGFLAGAVGFLGLARRLKRRQQAAV
ncbi:MAG TPA: VPLPA-CTERM sorting domain-containing protein [Paracoccaceae bacterium]|nr:VPLPA-CTERM sorting domain-containing protein [Paracoccaceae bacterium]